jgi:hypothetical protein
MSELDDMVAGLAHDRGMTEPSLVDRSLMRSLAGLLLESERDDVPLA